MIQILYRDSSLLVCLKPPGVPAQDAPDGGGLPQLLAAKEGGACYPVHRLDQGVGGVMVLARTRPAAAALSAAIQSGGFQKDYLCVALGQPEEDQGTWRDLLLHDRARNKSFVVSRPRAGVKEASLDYRVLVRQPDRALVAVSLHTGRTHQIRVQFASRGLPLAGDGKYGGGRGPIALWSAALAFPHPDSGERMRFARLPQGGIWEELLPLAGLPSRNGEG